MLKLGYAMLLSILVLMTILSTNLCRAQVATVVKKLDDHSFEVLIDGKRFKAVDNELLNEQKRSFDKLTDDFSDCQAHNTEKALQITKLEGEKAAALQIVERADAQRDSALADATRARADAKSYLGLSVKLDTLLTESRQLTPHGNVGGFGGKLLKFMDSSYFQAFVKVAAPTGTFLRAYTARCSQ